MIPPVPTRTRCEQLLDELAYFVARGGAGALLAPPVIPGQAAFPERWRPTRAGVTALLRRLAWHAQQDRDVFVEDARLGAPPTERRPSTRVGLLSIDKATLHFRCEFLGADDIAGTLAHELGVAHAALHRRETVEPYRVAERTTIEIDAERDHERGSIAAVYLGLGVLAANAAFQQYANAGRWNGGYVPHEYEVIQAGYVKMSDLIYLLAVQTVVRGAGELPAGLSGPQRDEARAWFSALRSQTAELRDRLGITQEALDEAARDLANGDPREAPAPFADVVDDADEPVRAQRNAWRVKTHRGGMGVLAGGVLGGALAMMIAVQNASPFIVLGAMGAGHVAGRRVRALRCTGCASLVGGNETTCHDCGASLRGDIETHADRLEAEERLERDGGHMSHPGPDA